MLFRSVFSVRLKLEIGHTECMCQGIGNITNIVLGYDRISFIFTDIFIANISMK